MAYMYVCSRCLEQLAKGAEFCPEHPAATVESVWIPTKAEIEANCEEFCPPTKRSAK